MKSYLNSGLIYLLAILIYRVISSMPNYIAPSSFYDATQISAAVIIDFIIAVVVNPITFMLIAVVLIFHFYKLKANITNEEDKKKLNKKISIVLSAVTLYLIAPYVSQFVFNVSI